jgi:hypothetical protein
MPPSTRFDIVYETCLLLVKHFRHLLQLKNGAAHFHTRLFSHMLHPEEHFVGAGTSQAVGVDTPTHWEHIVPCATLMGECRRLLREGKLSDAQIAALLHKHWKVALITQGEQRYLDHVLGLKTTMPPKWTFENGDTFDRFTLANIVLV